MPTLPPEDVSDIRRWAARAWLEMEAAGVPPTPHNFNLWFTHVSGRRPDLSQQITAALSKQTVMTPADLATLHANFPSPAVDMDEVVECADEIQQTTQIMVDDVAGHNKALQHYGNILDHWTAKLGDSRTVDNLVQAVATLAAETARAAERNRVLEQQLSAATARVTRLKDSMVHLKRDATTDPLTGLVNRKAFNSRLRRALADAKAEASSLSVLMLDVDHFKRVNDTYGHHTGDLVLRLIGRLLSESIKGRDTSARYGGEEFAVLLVGADLSAGAIVANQVRLALAGKQLVKKRGTSDFDSITVSVGVAQYRPTDTLASLLERADAAMYQAKQRGRNQVCTSDDTASQQWSQPGRSGGRRVG